MATFTGLTIPPLHNAEAPRYSDKYDVSGEPPTCKACHA